MVSQLIPIIPPLAGTAGPPFDDPNGDVVIRSSDGIDFHVFKVHLASEVLNHVFSSATAEPADGVPIIPIHEPSPILHALLLHCSGVGGPVGLREVQDLALKYEMFGVARAIYRERNTPEYGSTPSPMLHTIRQRMGQNQDLYLAAFNIVTSSENDATEQVIDLELITRAQANSLLQYRDKCRQAAVAVVAPPHNHFAWMSPAYNWFRTDVQHDCNRGGNIFIANVHGKCMMRFWWREYLYAARRQLENEPWGATVTSGGFFNAALEAGSRCRVCRENLNCDFRQFTQLLAGKINEAVSQARLRVAPRLQMLLTSISGILGRVGL